MPALPAIDVDSPVTARRAGIGMSVLFMADLDVRKIIAESAKIVLALFAESANVSLLPLSGTNTKQIRK